MDRVPSKRKPADIEVHDQRGKFMKGNAASPGRPKGSKDRFGRDLKECILEAASRVGADGRGRGKLLGYLETCARQHRKQYLQVLSKLVPIQVRQTGDALIGNMTIQVMPVPSGSYLTNDGRTLPGDAMMRMQDERLIEGTAVEDEQDNMTVRPDKGQTH
jgi:hypothetical protein